MLKMLRFLKPETMRERQGRPDRIFVCAHGQVVDNTNHGDKSRARRGWVESRAQSDSQAARPKKRAFLLLFDN